MDVLRDAGIDVVSTLHVQHLESLNDTVESLTGVRVRETIPDRVLDEADEVIIIDLSPEGARARMQHGHIYPPEQARAALQNFFRPENLAALRELALKRTAEEVDDKLEEYMREASRAVQAGERELARTLELAEDLNARVLPLTTEGYVMAVADLVKAEGIQHIVVKHERRSALVRLVRPSLADRILTAAPATQVHLVREHS